MENNEKEKKSIFTRIYNWFKALTFGGLIRFIVIVIIIILIIISLPFLPRIISRASSSLSAALYSIFVPAENATMTANKKIVSSGEDFTVTFNKGDVSDGIFNISYACDSSLNLLAVESAGLKNVNCDKPYYVLNSNNAVTLRPITTDQSVVRLVIDGSLENNETQKIEKVGVVRITVTNDAGNYNEEPIVATSTSPLVVPPVYVAPAPAVNLTPGTSNPNYRNYVGRPDLAVRILQTGILNPNTNQIVTRSQFTSSDMVGIKFEVRNDGDANTGIWYFSAFLPSASTPVYAPGAQMSLRPGESIVYTLGFSNLANQYSNVITIRADQNNLVTESNENNNTQTSTIINTAYNNNNNSNNNGCYVNGWFTYNCTNSSDGIDLAVEILEVGRINSSGNFVEDDEIDRGDTAAIRFRVTNEGDEDSGRWDYEVKLTPSFSGDEYTKRNMNSLDPGERVTITVEFDDIDDTGTNRFRVEIDPDTDLDEDERDNNDATETIEVD